MRNDLVHSHRYRDSAQLSAMAESGIDLGLAVLLSDTYYNDYDCLHDQWAQVSGDVIKDFGSTGHVHVTVQDLSGRFQLNSLVETKEKNAQGGESNNISPDEARKVLIRLLVSGNFAVEDEVQAEEIVDSLMDWLDSDDETRDYGAESEYYRSLTPPYRTVNGLMTTPNEMLAVKGVTRELLFGTDEKEGIAKYITVFGTDGKININTADEIVITALHEDLVAEDGEQLVAFREDEQVIEQLANATWYRNVPGWPGTVELDAKLVTTASTYFKIDSEAALADIHLSMSAFVKRTGKKKLEIVYRKTE